MNREKVKKLTAVIKEILSVNEELFEEANVSARIGAGTFGNTEYTIKVKLADLDEDGNVHTREAEAWEQYAPLMELGSWHVGDTFHYKGDECTITGYNTRAKKYPCQYSKNGKNYKTTEAQMIIMLGRGEQQCLKEKQ